MLCKAHIDIVCADLVVAHARLCHNNAAIRKFAAPPCVLGSELHAKPEKDAK